MKKKSHPRQGARRRARWCALQVLFQLDGHAPEGGEAALDEVLALFWKHVDPEAAANLETTRHAERLITGVLERPDELDLAIQTATQHWRVDRMSRVDRNILRLAAYELLHLGVDARIVINEAVELAKAFGTEESGAFVNGVLDQVAGASAKVQR